MGTIDTPFVMIFLTSIFTDIGIISSFAPVSVNFDSKSPVKIDRNMCEPVVIFFIYNGKKLIFGYDSGILLIV